MRALPRRCGPRVRRARPEPAHGRRDEQRLFDRDSAPRHHERRPQHRDDASTCAIPQAPTCRDDGCAALTNLWRNPTKKSRMRAARRAYAGSTRRQGARGRADLPREPDGRDDRAYRGGARGAQGTGHARSRRLSSSSRSKTAQAGVQVRACLWRPEPLRSRLNSAFSTEEGPCVSQLPCWSFSE